MSSSEEPLILAIETAMRSGSVALARGDRIRSSATGEASESHSISLLKNIENILQKGGARLSDIDAFAAASGPGSFTGLRIGLATTKAFAVCAGRKCVGVSTLAAIAHAAGESEHTLALLPAGRGELFAQLYSVSKGSIQALDQPAHLASSVVLERYGDLSDVVLAGEGAHALSELLVSTEDRSTPKVATAHPGKRWRLAPRCAQLAISIAALALNEYRKGNILNPDELRADYVRASDAETNERWQQKSAPPLPA